jgi:hypothetical protein
MGCKEHFLLTRSTKPEAEERLKWPAVEEICTGELAINEGLLKNG